LVGNELLKIKNEITMTVFKVNNRPVPKTWNGIVNDLFSDFENRFIPGFPTGSFQNTPVNISETANAYHLDVLAAGRNKEWFTIKVEKDVLTVGYEVKEKDEKPGDEAIRTEFAAGAFSRAFTLDEKVNAESIEARYEDGILKITLAKKAEVKPEVKKITIQ
jgi:HSP20 family protein